MPSTLSKFLATHLLGHEWSFGYNCYEVGHTWTPNCTEAALEVSLAAGLKVVPLYALLYSFSQLALQRRLDSKATSETAKSIARSTFFIIFHAYSGAILGCALRRSFGRFYYRVLVCMPALMSSYLSLLIEKKARRQALAFYLLNLASEIIFHMLVTKGYIQPLRHGETLIFALSLAAWFHLLKENGFGNDPISSAMRLLVGSAETRHYKERRRQRDCDAANIEINQSRRSTQETSPKLIDSISRRLGIGKCDCCPHSEATCLRYWLRPLPARFALGYLIQTALRLSSKPMELLRRPSKTIRDNLYHTSSVRFGLFFVSLVLNWRLVSCLLRRCSQSDEVQWHGPVAGLSAGLSMFWSPKASLSMYIMWKAVEQHYLIAAKKHGFKSVDFAIMTIYSASAAAVLYTFALEPKFIRPSYMRFIDTVSNHRLHQLNRMVLDVFGTGSSIGYEDYFPDLDPKFMSNQFKELIFNWMIQPYD